MILVPNTIQFVIEITISQWHFGVVISRCIDHSRILWTCHGFD